MTTVTATDLARHTREVLDQVIAQGRPIAVERNRRVIAEIVPARRTLTARQALADLRPMLTPEHASEWLKDSRQEFDDALRDPWT